MMKILFIHLLLLGSLGLFAVDKVNINTADKDRLVTVKGIGPVLAQKIIDYRTEHGAFATVDDLEKVKGIGSVTLEKLKPMITVSAPKPATLPATESTPSETLDLNEATVGQLQKLPGIGEALAKRIVSYRQTNGDFKSVDDLEKVEGIYASTIAKFSSAVTVKRSSGESPNAGDVKTSGRKLKVWRPSF